MKREEVAGIQKRAQWLYEIHQEREAYDNAVGLVSIAQVLEIIDELETKEITGTIDKEVGYQEAIDDFHDAVLALRGNE